MCDVCLFVCFVRTDLKELTAYSVASPNVDHCDSCTKNKATVPCSWPYNNCSLSAIKVSRRAL